MRGVQSGLGTIGYRHQLDRARRFLDRVEASLDQVEFQDMMWSFFQHCWHVKDWVDHDPLASPAQKNNVIAQAHASAPLQVCRDLCNGTKHLLHDQPTWTGARQEYVNTTIVPGQSSSLDCLIDDGQGTQMSGKDLARRCIAEWERIFQSERLATARLS
jgi:hypothetical protein